MQLVRTLINTNNEKYEHFAYYETIITVIEQNVSTNPDICIEGCKSLLEGISKTILKTLDPTISNKTLEGKDFHVLFREALTKLSEYNEKIEFEFVRRASSLINALGEIRNKRGDISHGRLAPKELASYSQFSKLVSQMTEGIAFYVLEQFFAIDLSFKDEVKYENNIDFNQMLDEVNFFENLSYSKALFDQDYVAYCEQLLEYESEQERLRNLESEETE
jgi:hypothetical protein